MDSSSSSYGPEILKFILRKQEFVEVKVLTLFQCRCKPCRRKKKCVRVQMYLQGRYLSPRRPSEEYYITVLFLILCHRILTTFLNSLFRSIQEIEATRFDQEGKTVPATGQFESRRADEERDEGDDEENSPHDAKGALESSLSSLGSPSPSLQSLPSPDQVNSSSVGDTIHL